MHPIIFQTKFFTLYTFWVFFALAIIIGTYTLIRLSLTHNLKLQFLSENTFRLIILTIIGARVFALIENYQTYFYELSSNTLLQLFYIWDKGLNLAGAITGFIIALYFLCKKFEQDFWGWLDVIIPSFIIGLAIGHMGAFFEGINYGNETSLPWGVNFESPAIKYAVPIHPTQIYAFLYSITLFGILIFLSHIEKIKNLKSGFIGLLGVTFYTFLGFSEGFVRGDDTLMFFGIRVPQILSLTIAITTGILLYRRYNDTKYFLFIKKFITKIKHGIPKKHT